MAMTVSVGSLNEPWSLYFYRTTDN